jgi:hypothetical protein
MPCAEIAVAGIHNRFVDVFDLDGCVIDLEFFVHQGFDTREYGTVIETVRRHYDVAAHGKHARRESPDMKIMHRTNAGNLVQLLLKINDIDVRQVPSNSMSTASRIKIQELKRISTPTTALIIGSAIA